MGELVEQYGHEINVVAVIVVQAQVPEGSGQAAGSPQTDVETGADVRLARIQVKSRALFRESGVVPGEGEFRSGEGWIAGKVRKDVDRAGRAQHSRTGGATQGFESGQDFDLDIAG